MYVVLAKTFNVAAKRCSIYSYREGGFENVPVKVLFMGSLLFKK